MLFVICIYPPTLNKIYLLTYSSITLLYFINMYCLLHNRRFLLALLDHVICDYFLQYDL